MDVWSCVLVTLAITLAILTWISSSRRPKNFPPGPNGLPLVGYYPFLGRYPFKTFMTLGKKYGNCFAVTLGQTPVVVLNDWAAVKEAAINQAEVFSGRPKNKVYEDMIHNADIVLSGGPGWRQRRRFALQHLKSLGFGKSIMEDIVMEEIHHSCKLLSTLDNKNDVIDYFFTAMLNIIWRVVAGVRYERHDEVMTKFTATFRMLVQQSTATNPLIFMPYLRHLFRGKYKAFLNENRNIEHFLSRELERHELVDHTGSVTDFMDAYLQEIQKRQRTGEDTSSFQRVNVIQVCKNLFIAGTDTSSSTLLWGLLYMAVWPSIQKKVQEELDRVIGRDRKPNYADRTLLPYSSAVILETMRYSSIVPLVPRTTTASSSILGFSLPVGTMVLLNLWSVHHDPAYWKDPDIYRPERFLNGNGNIEKPDYLIPFSAGIRMCLGESLAKMTSFLFFTSILQQFTVSLQPGVTLPSLDPIYAITLSPEPFKLVFKPR